MNLRQSWTKITTVPITLSLDLMALGHLKARTAHQRECITFQLDQRWTPERVARIAAVGLDWSEAKRAWRTDQPYNHYRSSCGRTDQIPLNALHGDQTMRQPGTHGISVAVG